MKREVIKVLLVENNPDHAYLILEYLAKSKSERFKSVRVDRLSEGLARLVDEDFSVVLLDMGLPDSQGMETFQRVHSQAPNIPILLLTSLDDTILALSTVQTGAQDYLVKGKFDNRLLTRSIRYAIERKRAEVEIREQAAQLESLRKIGLELTAQLDLNTLLHTIASQAIKMLDGASGGLHLHQPERDVLEWTVAVGSNMAPIGTILHKGEGLSGKVWETGESLIVDDYQNWEGRAAVYEKYSLKATVGVPILWRENFLGVLNVMANPPKTFTSKDADLLSLLATHAAIAIQNARLYEQAQQEIVDRKRAEEIVSHMAYHDALTDLPNRRLFTDRLTMELAHARRDQHKLAVLLLDLDNFKDVNDQFGHSTGDKLLKEVAVRLRSLLRQSDTVARMGGDEFMLILPEITGEKDASAVARKVLESFRKPFIFNGHEFRITTSIGFAMFPEDGEDGDILVRHADVAMYQAKNRGRDEYQRFSDM